MRNSAETVFGYHMDERRDGDNVRFIILHYTLVPIPFGALLLQTLVVISTGASEA